MTDAPEFMADSYRNIVAAIGTSKDKSSGGHYMPMMLTQDQLINAYRSSWLAKKIIDIIPEDAFREWRSWNAEKEEISKIEDEEKRLNLKETLYSAMRSARLFGLAAIHFAMEGDNEESLAEEIDPEAYGLGSIQHLTILPRNMLNIGEIENDPLSIYFGKPKYYEVRGNSAATSIRIHPSRLIILTGQEVPEGGFATRSQFAFDSVLQSVIDTILKADSTSANVASLVFEAKVDVIRIEGLNRDVTRPGYEDAMLARFSLANLAKSNNSTLLLDKSEEYDSKHYGFGQLPEIMDRFAQNVAGAADIPMTRLYGMSPAGLNATGESDLKNYYDRIKIMQELDLDPRMSIFNTVLKISALGKNDPKIWHEWRPLWQMSEKELVEVGKGITGMASELVKNNIINPEAMSEATANALIEYGVFPGLESAVEEFGVEPPEATPEELAAAMGQRPKPKLVASNDENPKRRMTREEVEFWREYIEGQGFDVDDPEFDPRLDPDIEIVESDGKTPVKDYNPDQPRHPAGTSRGGQFAKGTGGATGEAAGGQVGSSGGRAYVETDAASYARAAAAAKASMGEVGKQVTVAEEADAYFVAKNGMSAFAMKGNDFIGVTNNKNNPERGVVGDMLKVAEQYARANNYDELTLDCFDGFLPKYYGKFGFEETERVKFDWQYAPDGWTEANGEPDVVFMRKKLGAS